MPRPMGIKLSLCNLVLSAITPPCVSSFPRRITSNSRERSTWIAAHGLCYSGDMTIKRLDHVSVVVDDLAAAIAFFTALGMTIEGKAPIEGPWVDRVNGLEGVQVDIVMMRTPDGHGKLRRSFDSIPWRTTIL